MTELEIVRKRAFTIGRDSNGPLCVTLFEDGETVGVYLGCKRFIAPIVKWLLRSGAALSRAKGQQRDGK